LVRLPTGEGLWIDANGNFPQVLDIVGATTKEPSNVFYFVDSSSNPQILTDYFGGLSRQSCPPKFRILNCNIELTLKRLPNGPPVIGRDVGGGDGVDFGYPDRLRTMTLSSVPPSFFISLSGSLHRVSGAKDDVLLRPLLAGIAQPTAIRVNAAALARFAMLAGEPVAPGQPPRVHLQYLGGKRWSAPVGLQDQANRAARDIGYRISLESADVICCGAPTEPIQPRVLPSVGGEVQWRGQVIDYELLPFGGRQSGYWDVLFDPSDETILVLGVPQVKAFRQLPPVSGIQ
jgi:hypothetical protein